MSANVLKNDSDFISSDEDSVNQPNILNNNVENYQFNDRKSSNGEK
jgi:hypothetical protein